MSEIWGNQIGKRYAPGKKNNSFYQEQKSEIRSGRNLDFPTTQYIGEQYTWNRRSGMMVLKH